MATTAALTENSRQGINLQILPCIGQEAWLSRNPRWGCGHAYDETPVGLVVYVRNDPVNYIDPDGRQAERPGRFREDGVFMPNDPFTFTSTSGASSYDSWDGGASMINDIMARLIWEGPWTPVGSGGYIIGNGSGGTPPAQSLDSLLANKALLEAGLKTRAGIQEKKGPCYDFLVKVIAQLNSGRAPTLAPGFTVEKLISNVMAAAKAATTVAALGANARTQGNTISIASDPREPMGNDYFSTLLHEGFHLLMSSMGRAQITDDRLRYATSEADGTRYQGGSTSEFNKQMFGQNCGPGT